MQSHTPATIKEIKDENPAAPLITEHHASDKPSPSDGSLRIPASPQVALSDDDEEGSDSLLNQVNNSTFGTATGRPRADSTATGLIHSLLSPQATQPAPLASDYEEDYVEREDKDEDAEEELEDEEDHQHHRARFDSAVTHIESGQVEGEDEEEEEEQQYEQQPVLRTAEDFYRNALNCLHHADFAIDQLNNVNYFNLINEVHFNTENDQPLPHNRFLSLVCHLGDLAYASHNAGASELVNKFIKNSLKLTLDLADKHIEARQQRKDASYSHKYEYRMAALDNTVIAVQTYLADISNPASNLSLTNSITNLQNNFQYSSNFSFFRESPYLSAVLGASLMLMGVGFLAAGIFTVSVLTPLSVTAITFGAIFMSLGLSMMLAPIFFRGVSKDEKDLNRQSNYTARDAHALLASPSTLFISKKSLIGELLKSVAAEADNSLDETRLDSQNEYSVRCL